MSVTKTVFRNAFFSYGRTLIATVLTLFSSRWILSDLGASDFGLYGLVGGVLTFVTLIAGVLNQGSNRFMAYATGSDDALEVRRWFNVAANVYFCLPVVLLPIGWVLGDVFVKCILKIPPDRVAVSLWIVRFTLLSLTVTLLSMPYQSLLIARQHIHIYAVVMLCQSVGTFLIALALPHCPGDHLFVYGALMSASMIVMQLVFIVVCRRMCPDGRICWAYWWQWARVRELAMYSGWMFVGSLGMFVREQGLNVIVNWMRGTAANAGRAIGHQLGAQTETLYNAFAMALNPEIMRREGAGAHDNMLALAKRSERFGMIIMLLVGLPLFCECEYVLTLWLKNPPAYAVFFTRIQILIAILCKMRIGHMMCFQAIGRAKPQQVVDFAFYMATVLVVGAVYIITRSLEVSFYCYVAFQTCYMVVYVIVGSRYFEWPLLTLLREIVVPSGALFVLGYGLFYGFERLWTVPSFGRLSVSTLLSCAYIGLGSLVFILKREDRFALGNLVSKIMGRVRHVYS